jgi:hypothetical protein
MLQQVAAKGAGGPESHAGRIKLGVPEHFEQGVTHLAGEVVFCKEVGQELVGAGPEKVHAEVLGRKWFKAGLRVFYQTQRKREFFFGKKKRKGRCEMPALLHWADGTHSRARERQRRASNQGASAILTGFLLVLKFPAILRLLKNLGAGGSIPWRGRRFCGGESEKIFFSRLACREKKKRANPPPVAPTSQRAGGR